MRPRGRRALTLVLLVLLPVLGAIGAAVAYWNSTGTGSATSTVASSASLTLAPGTPAASLYPGGSSDVSLAVTNPNPGTVVLRSLALDTTRGTGGFAVDAGHSGCALSALSFTTNNNGGAGWTIAAGSQVVNVAGPLAMSTSAADACQGATFTVYLKAGP